jgi:maleylpyruvate isomerase
MSLTARWWCGASADPPSTPTTTAVTALSVCFMPQAFVTSALVRGLQTPIHPPLGEGRFTGNGATPWQPKLSAVILHVVTLSADLCRKAASAATERTMRIVKQMRGLSVEALHSPSALPDWSRLTIACHLHYGAEALCRMTRSALAGEPVAYYPEGREGQRPGTLVPLPGEHPLAVVESLVRASEELHKVWSSLEPDAWNLDVVEPEENPDLGTLPLARLPLLRLTEVEVHGSDLGIGLNDWGELFVRLVLPMRLDWLNARRVNHRSVDANLNGSWLLVATDGPTYRVSVNGANVESRPANPSSSARAVIKATSRDLLALLLGRPFHAAPVITGDASFGEAFSDAFPGP